MNESNGKKQAAALWILGILVVILIAIIAGLFIMQAQTRNKELVAKDEKISQIEQELAQVKSQLQQETEKKNYTQNNITNTSNIIGLYSVIPDKNLTYDEGLGRTMDDMAIELYENNQFSIYDSWGTSYYGSYTAVNNIITLNIIKWNCEEGGSSQDVIFSMTETANIKLKEYNGILEVIEAPLKAKVNRSDVGNGEMSFNIKVGVKYIKNNIVGEWKADSATDENGNDIPLQNIFGSGIRNGNKLTFKSYMEYINGIGITGEGNEGGTYTISSDTILLKDKQQRERKLQYNSLNDTLQEIDEDYLGNKRIITYTRIKQ